MRFMKTVMLISGFSLLISCASTEQLNEESSRNYHEIVRQVKKEGKVDTRSRTARRIQRVFKKMRPYAKMNNTTGVPFQWEMTVVRTKELNAWAMPGGKMMFYTGLVERLKLNNHEIATIMGHEMSHALKEHTKSSQTVDILGTLGAIAGKAVLENYGISTDIGRTDMTAVLKDLGLDKPYSRKLETEADEMGLMLMAQAGFNPKYAPNVWKKMTKASGDGISFFSTHPSNTEREKDLERLLPEAMAIYRKSR
ncbi:MAG: M48 family metallopeptidase [Alcaligenaceae bacterium]|nr:M48 family metallopeptidase [Alcaligenaceae bacterium]